MEGDASDKGLRAVVGEPFIVTLPFDDPPAEETDEDIETCGAASGR